MKHVVLSHAWTYTSTAKAYQIRFGIENSQTEYLPMIDIKPSRQLVVADRCGNFRLATGHESVGDFAFSVLALPQDEFGYAVDRRTQSLTFRKQQAGRPRDCLLFAGCRDGVEVNKHRTTGHVLRTYLQLFDTFQRLEFVSTLGPSDRIVIDKAGVGCAEYIWDGRILTKTEID